MCQCTSCTAGLAEIDLEERKVELSTAPASLPRRRAWSMRFEIVAEEFDAQQYYGPRVTSP